MVRWLSFLPLLVIAALAEPAGAQVSQAGPPAERPELSLAPPAAMVPAVTGRFVLPKRSLWVGEVFPVRLIWQVNWTVFRYLDGDLIWTADPLVAEGLAADSPGPPRVAPDATTAELSFTTYAMALSPGSFNVKPARQRMQMVTGSYDAGGITIANLGAVTAVSSGAPLKVRALPAAPREFTGAVGHFALTSSLSTREGRVGEPMVWTVRLSGTGNWTGFAGVPPRPLPRDFEMIGAPQDTAKDPQGKPASLFQRSLTEAITIVPRNSGSFALGPVEMTVFDPTASRYLKITAPPVALNVQPGSAASPSGEATPAMALPVALPPALYGTGDAWPPLPTYFWRASLAAPIVAVSLAWLGMAVQRARRTDPNRALRAAHGELIRTLAALAANPDDGERRRLLRVWQHEVGIRFKVPHAAPSSSTFADALWSRLWEEVERHLYGRHVPLLQDWPARAQAALAALGAPPPWDPRSVLAAGQLYPVTLVAALMCVLVTAFAAPLTAGGYAHAVQADALRSGDWVGHYSLARKAAQGQRWDRAAALAGKAWVQHPGSRETTRLWALTAQEAGFAGWAAGGLPLPSELSGEIAGLLPPIGWQLATLAAELAGALGLALLLALRFGYLQQYTVVHAAAMAIGGAVGLASGLVGLASWGVAASPDSAILSHQVPLRELPVESPVNESPILLVAGTTAHRGRAFLGWVQVTLADGRHGWLRREDVLPLWQG